MTFHWLIVLSLKGILARLTKWHTARRGLIVLNETKRKSVLCEVKICSLQHEWKIWLCEVGKSVLCEMKISALRNEICTFAKWLKWLAKSLVEMNKWNTSCCPYVYKSPTIVSWTFAFILWHRVLDASRTLRRVVCCVMVEARLTTPWPGRHCHPNRNFT